MEISREFNYSKIVFFSNTVLSLEGDNEPKLGIDEVFDILPIYGELEPGQSVKTTITFYGHPFVNAECKAICEVDGGPEYEINLQGRVTKTIIIKTYFCRKFQIELYFFVDNFK